MRLATYFSIFFLACSSEQATSSTAAPAPTSSVEPGEDPQPVDPVDNDADPDGGANTSKDSGPKADANVAPADILGTLTGSCGVVKTYLTATTSSFVENGLE